MLMLMIKAGKYVQIGKDIKVYFHSHTSPNCMKVGIDCPEHIQIVREDAIVKTKKEVGND